MPKQSPSQRDFLLSFFDEPHDTFALVQVDDFILNRYVTPEGHSFVAVYTKEAYKNSISRPHHSISKTFSLSKLKEDVDI
jgi:hypothetical protein